MPSQTSKRTPSRSPQPSYRHRKLQKRIECEFVVIDSDSDLDSEDEYRPLCGVDGGGEVSSSSSSSSSSASSETSESSSSPPESNHAKVKTEERDHDNMGTGMFRFASSESEHLRAELADIEAGATRLKPAATTRLRTRKLVDYSLNQSGYACLEGTDVSDVNGQLRTKQRQTYTEPKRPPQKKAKKEMKMADKDNIEEILDQITKLCDLPLTKTQLEWLDKFEKDLSRFRSSGVRHRALRQLWSEEMNLAKQAIVEDMEYCIRYNIDQVTVPSLRESLEMEITVSPNETENYIDMVLDIDTLTQFTLFGKARMLGY